MPKLRTAVIAGAATLLLASAAYAATAQFHTMSVDLPDGSVAHITYAGDVAPKVAVAANPAEYLGVAADPFLAMDQDFARVSAIMQAQRQDMMRQVAAMQRQGVAGGQAAPFVVTGTMPAGAEYSYTMVSTSNGGKSCTRTVEWRSNGVAKVPQVTRASAGDCGAVKAGEGVKPVPVSAPARAAPIDPRSI